MARRKAQPTNQTPTTFRADDPPIPARVLIVSGSRTERERLAARLSGRAISCAQADSVGTARDALRTGAYDLAIVQAKLKDGLGTEVALEASGRSGTVATIILADAPTLDEAVMAMRSGASDVMPSTLGAEEFVERVRAAAGRARLAREREERLERLRRVCRRLNTARRDVTRQVSTLCTDLTTAYQDLSDQMTHVATASEFNSLVRQELDLESLLRTALEFVLAKVGPTNAAVFLPSGSGDYTLGAYVNYDCPRDGADVLLDHLAGIIAPQFQDRLGVTLFADEEELAEFLGGRATWLTDSTMVAFSCHHDGECLAVVTLFRDRRTPFPATVLPMFQMLSELFARQLARVIHVHHRHLPKDQWGGFGEPDDGDVDLAA